MAKNRIHMDTESYDRGVIDLPNRLKLYAMFRMSDHVEMQVNEEQAVLLADDLESGILLRPGVESGETPEARAALDLPKRLRTYAMIYSSVKIGMSLKEAQIFAEDLERGLQQRLPDAPKRSGGEHGNHSQ